MVALQKVKKVYRAIVPQRLRHAGLVQRVKAATFPHRWIYDDEYYARDVEAAASASAPVIVRSVMREAAPRRVLDVGCGTGAMLAEFAAAGCTVRGLEYADAAIARCRARGIEVTKFDIEHDSLDDDTAWDVAISMEVAEHLPEKIADPYVDLLCARAPVVVMTAAPPGQGGTDHVNEQPPEYWIAKCAARGFDHDAALTARLRAEWAAAGVTEWYHRNLLVFRRRLSA
jgi:SAM-dependent methyltransferase